MDSVHTRTIDKLRASIGSVLLGKAEVVDLALVALLARGHVLIDDVPGVGKTLLARAIAQSLDCTFRRIQFTPDLLPSDILGTSVYNTTTGEFTFKPGPLFANVVLADEINRTTPRTQSALLEAMSDGQISFDGETHSLGDPFLVLATQNPFEFEGTYLLPENQLDRFLIRISIGYPARDEEKRLLAEHRGGEPIDLLRAVASREEITSLQSAVRQVAVDDGVVDYLLDIVEASRAEPELHVGVSTRGSLMLYRAAQALAILRGRDFAVPDDVKEMAVAVLAHRIIAKSIGSRGGIEACQAILNRILDRVPVRD